jgi:hypothetical protein
MKGFKKKTGILIMFMALLIILTMVASVQAQPYAITWWTVGGGGTSSGGSHVLSGTIGQPDAGVMSGGGYTLTGGFWGLGTLDMIYLPLIFKN